MCDEQPRFRDAGLDLVIVGNGTVEQARWFVSTRSLEADLFADPDLATYHAVGTRSGLRTVLHPGSFLAAWRAFRNGFRQQGVKGEPMLQGGVFVIRRDGEAPYAYRSRYAGDHPEPAAVVSAALSAVAD